MISRFNWKELVPRLEADLWASQQFPGSWRRDDEAWEHASQLLRARAPSVLFKYVAYIRPEDVEDVVQNVLVKLQSLNTIRRMKAARSVEGYVSVVLRNAAIDLSRRQRSEREGLREREQDLPIEQIPSHEMTTEDALGLAEALNYLSDAERSLLENRFWQNMSIREIAAENKKTYSATAVSLFRVLRRLRHLMNVQG
jgi:RNA polymerase sigma factor (sigma-70 family)